MLKEFKEFALRGNVVDMAIGVIIGAAFGAIINSLVEDLLMPIISLLIGTVNFSSMVYTAPGGAVLQYGNFIQKIVNFFIIALFCFLFVKLFTRQKKEEAPAPEPSDETRLLTEIRDMMKAEQK